MATLAFIGLGSMGMPMAERLLDAGHRLRVFARRPAAAAKLVERGALALESPAEAARGARFVITNVTTTADVEQILLGEAGIVHTAQPGTIVIDHSTISSLATRAMAKRLAERGVALLDCPVSGGVAGARAGTLTIMVGGDAAALQQARPLLARIGSTITHVGPSGSGQVAKACNQIIQVITIQGIAEAMRFAASQGVEPGRVLEAIRSGFAASRMLDLMGPKMVDRNFAAGMQARLHRKDFGLVSEAAHQAGLSLPAVELVERQLQALVARGWGQDDTSSLLRVLEDAGKSEA
jgi:3-hydroxyisobutyrate dehydrogenase-like beta-hydroxyacid dehydrogenase